MACSSLVALPRACGTDGVIAGTEKLYMVAFADLSATTVSGDVYSASTATGIINSITLDGGKKFVEIGLLRSSTGLDETLTKDVTKGTSFFTKTLTLVLSDLTTENRTFINSVLNQPVAIIIKSRTGKYYAAGLNGLFELATAQGGSGVADADLIGYTLTFTGIDKSLIPLVDSTIIPSLIA